MTRILGLAAGLLLALAAQAQTFPAKPVTLIVPWPAGGSSDLYFRKLGEVAARHLGQPLVIENRPGGSGMNGPATMAKTARPDGYTISQLTISAFRAAPGCASNTRVRTPHWASTWTMPRPMVPEPATPATRSAREASSMRGKPYSSSRSRPTA